MASFLSERNVCFGKTSTIVSKFHKYISAQTIHNEAPNPTIDNSVSAVVLCKIICFQMAHMATKPGNNIIIDNKILIFAFFSNEREIAKKIKKLIDVSSIKSIESASKETDLMFRATINSIKKKY